jgi:hypothetical protein
MDYRNETNVAVLWYGYHTKGRQCMGGIGQEKETKNLAVGDVLTVEE